VTHELVGISKQLSYVLRHRPESIGVTLDDAGWVEIETPLGALAAHGRDLTRGDLDRVVAGTDKRRFEVSGERIRAAQGHSVKVDLRLDPVPPPRLLFHGTVERFLTGIFDEGLRPGGRRQVHLSADQDTARTVGARRGRPVILSIDAAGMHAAGHLFYRAANGVWLTDHVPPQWISRQSP
jgi:putative RNA 2'-phosphotransferase